MISFIIPAFNEEGVIGNTIEAIVNHCPIDDKEIIVVDNGSNDQTAQEASGLGANGVSFHEGTIAAARNYGVTQSSGSILVFIDADVLLTEKWQQNITAQIESLKNNPMQVTGSRCHPPENGNWFNQHWYKLMTKQSTNYINSGHLITTRELFDKISGFTESLKTAEDYDFCQKALKANSALIPNYDLVTIHDGYPKTLKHFIQRERWHGKEDYQSLNSTLNSKVAIVAILNLMLFATTLIYAMFTNDLSGLAVYVGTMLFVSISLTVIKFKQITPGVVSHTSLIHFLYIWGRGLAFLDRVFNTKIKRFRE